MAGPGLSTANTVGTGTPPADANTVANWLNKIDSSIQTPTAGKVLIGNGTLWVAGDPSTGIAPESWFNVKDVAYGAIGNGVNDDTIEVQAALTAANAAGGGIVYFPEGTYLCDDISFPGNNIIIQGAGWGSIIKQKNSGDNHYLVSVNPGSGGTTNPANNKTGCGIRDIQLLGTVATDAFQQHVFLLNLNACSNFIAQNVYFNGFRGDGAYVGSGNAGGIERHNVNIQFLNCLFDGVNQDNRNGISVIDCDGLLVEGCTFKNIGRTDMPGAIDLEPNSGSTYAVIRSIKILYNQFISIRGSSGAVMGYFWDAQSTFTNKIRDIKVIGNTFRDCLCPFFFQMPQQPSTSDIANDIEFAHNTVITATGDMLILGGVRGVQVHNNIWISCPKSVQFGYTYAVRDVWFDHNSAHLCGTDNGRLIFIYRANKMYLRFNDADGLNGEFVRFDVDGTGGTSDNICVTGNVPSSSGAFSSKNASHTISLATNLARSNDLAAMTPTTINTLHFTPEMIAASVTYDPPSLAAGVAANTTVTATGAATGDTVEVSHSSVDTAATSWILYGYVSAADTVRVIIFNATGGTVDLGSGTLRVRVFKQGFLN